MQLTPAQHEWEAGGWCRCWRVVTSLARRHLRQAIRMLQHAHCVNNFAENKTNGIDNAQKCLWREYRCKTMPHRSRCKYAANDRTATDANDEWREKDKQGQFGSNATEFGAGLGLPRLTGDGADDGTSNDARGRGATGRAGYSTARGERTVRGGWSWCWCWWRLSIRCIVNHLKRYV